MINGALLGLSKNVVIQAQYLPTIMISGPSRGKAVSKRQLSQMESISIGASNQKSSTPGMKQTIYNIMTQRFDETDEALELAVLTIYPSVRSDSAQVQVCVRPQMSRRHFEIVRSIMGSELQSSD
jgi:hypothetical protein